MKQSTAIAYGINSLEANSLFVWLPHPSRSPNARIGLALKPMEDDNDGTITFWTEWQFVLNKTKEGSLLVSNPLDVSQIKIKNSSEGSLLDLTQVKNNDSWIWRVTCTMQTKIWFSTTFCFIAFRIFMVFYFMLHAFSLWCHMPGSTRYFSYFPLDHISCSSYSRVIVLSWVKSNRLPPKEFYFYLWNIQGVGNKKAPFLSYILNKLPFILYYCHLDFYPIFILFCMLSACDLMCLVEPSSSLILLWII